MELTPAQMDMFATIMKQNKPHLIEIEDKARQVDYGSIVIRMDVRGGVVNKMTFIQTEQTWLSPKTSK